ncbi:HAD family hydrolase [Deinococcus soli (ex Cha et al. 2016)]|uniref:HAD family hydrolase n=1 Tax=Deinococcus soli (ex Cha et al. 2016) TaxID=1309411 RepID=UPI00069A67F0|nr:HAD family hydrolase [Deinococcus soli (ex Cha et al. 2016)]
MRPDLPAPLRFLAFDFDGTLTDFVTADIHALDTLRRAACPDVPPAAFEDRAVEEIMAFHDRVEAGVADPLRQDGERLGRTLAAYGVTLTEEHLGLYTRALVAATVPVPGAAELLRDLRAADVRLALLSNAYDGPAQRARVQACFPDVFEVVVIAGEVGALKPDPLPFRVLLDALGLPAGAGAYVGDSPEHDVRGAVAAGLSAWHVHAHPRVRERALAGGAALSVAALADLPLPS